jgi:hypothetical protein
VDIARQKRVERIAPNHPAAARTHARQLSAPNPEPDGFSRNSSEGCDFFDE